MNKVLIFDSTLRDGSHAIKHQFTQEIISSYCQSIENSGIYAIIVGHGNGLGASSLQVGLSLLSDHEMLSSARKNIFNAKLGVYLIPGFGTINNDLLPAIEDGVDLFKIGCHCTEANTTKQHIECLKNNNKEVYGILMMCHMASPERLLEETKKMQSYGASGVILMDSAGSFTPEMVKRTISLLTNNINIRIGFHPHNNLGIAIANAYTAVKAGATIIDGTLRGLGAGAGNCQLEAIIALLRKCDYNLEIDLNKLFDTSEGIIKPIMPEDKGLSDISIVSGMAGVFSAFKNHVLNAAKEFQVDPRDILIELGKKKVVAGQEDMIIDVAKNLSHVSVLGSDNCNENVYDTPPPPKPR
ncbi:MAG: 4-hydroxy-2-oxovalerate aldolase [Bacteroidales bacterium]|jgi:4-hydroxy 2-oxovalerate aldolase|nr:4-hydroxy-2-oxovalerate aldolase [Bacteroidales bacterium]